MPMSTGQGTPIAAASAMNANQRVPPPDPEESSDCLPDPLPADPLHADPQLPDPKHVLTDPSLTTQQKIEKLRRWSYDAREIDVANEEGMGGIPRPSNLGAIQDALRELGANDDASSHKQ